MISCLAQYKCDSRKEKHLWLSKGMSRVAVCCSVLQCVAVRCSTLYGSCRRKFWKKRRSFLTYMHIKFCIITTTIFDERRVLIASLILSLPQPPPLSLAFSLFLPERRGYIYIWSTRLTPSCLRALFLDHTRCWCVRCLLITERPKTPCHYRYQI